MALYMVFIDGNRRITNIPAWANPENRKEGEVTDKFIVLDLTDDQLAKAIPDHSMLTADNVIVTDADYVPPEEPSSDPRPDPSSVALAGLSAVVAKQGAMIANLTLQVAQLKAGK